MIARRRILALAVCTGIAAAARVQALDDGLPEFSNPWTTPEGSAAAGSFVDWGPFYSRFEGADGAVRERALGPFFERVRRPDGAAGVAVRPLIARETNAVTGRVSGDLLWPVGEFSSLVGESDWRVLVAWHRCFDAAAADPRWRLWVLPVYFQGRNAAGEPYAAVFPLGGRISEFFGQDDIRFAFFPLWMHSAVGELDTLDLLFPFYSLTRGRTTERFRLFPFYGRAEQFGNYTKRFILWPVWTEAAYTYPTSVGSGYILFPLFGRIELSDQSSWLVLPPFFRVSRGAEADRYYLPWPFVQIERGRQSRFHIWPLFGRTREPAVDRSYAAWPFLWIYRVHRGPTVQRSVWIVPVFNLETRRARYPEADAAAGEAGAAACRWKLWPLASYAREGENARFRALSLWPTRDFEATERSWAPLWTLVDRRRSADAAETEILWGMFRRSARGAASARTSVFPLVEWSGAVEPDGTRARSVSVLKGLVGWTSGGAGRELRLVYGVRIRL